MKVLEINVVCGYGSTGRIVVDLYNTLKSQGHECLCAYGRFSAPENENINTIRIGKKIDNYIHVFNTRIFDKHGFSSKRATKEFIKRVEEYNPDIIHLHNIHGYYINIEILFDYLKKSGKPVVWTLHDCWAFTGHCSYFDYKGCNKWVKGCENCIQKKEYPQSIFIDNSKNNYIDKKRIFTQLDNLIIITPSIWLANLVKKSFLSKYSIKVINNGIDLEIFKPTKSDFRKKYNIQGKKILLSVSNIWEKRKGIEYLIELAKTLDSSYQLVIVGKIDKKLKEKLSSNIICIDRTNNVKELVEIYSAADLFINTTLEDNFPTVNLEALACGTPVITFDTGGCGEIIKSEYGSVVKKDNIDYLTNEIKNISINEEIRKICVKRAQDFNKKNKYIEYINIFKSLLER